MSLNLASERVCYVQCNFCNTILAVNVPCTSLFNIVTVRCGHCANLLSVNMETSLQTVPIQDSQKQQMKSHDQDHSNKECGSSSKCNNKFSASDSAKHEAPTRIPLFATIIDCPSLKPMLAYSFKILPSKMSIGHAHRKFFAPEKRQRVPSAYNRFIKEEIQRIKASKPDISHREAFSTAAKNWAHFPHIHFGLKLDGNNKHGKLDEAIADQLGSQNSNGYY